MIMTKKFSWLEAVLIVVFLSAQFHAAFSEAHNLPNAWFISDDAYYYFKVAQKSSEGHGSTFDGIHLTNGYHPLWLLICIPIFALARFDLILPLRVLLVLMGLLSAATGIVLYRLFKSAVSPPVAMLAAAYWLFDYRIQSIFYRTGVESGIALFLLAVLLYLGHRIEQSWRTARPALGTIAWVGVVAALTVLSRLDLVFFCAVFGLWLILRGSPLRYLLPLDVLAVVISVVIAYLSRLGFEHYYDNANSALIMIVLALIFKIPALYFFGLYQRPFSWDLKTVLKSSVLAVIVGSTLEAGMLLALNFLKIQSAYSLSILLTDAVLTLLLILLVRAIVYVFRRTIARTSKISNRVKTASVNKIDKEYADWIFRKLSAS